MKIRLKWLEEKAEGQTSCTFSIPWDRGILYNEKSLIMQDPAGRRIETQSSVLAYWDDGSIKWTNHGISEASPAEYYEVSAPCDAPAWAADKEAGMGVAYKDFIQICNGIMRVKIPCAGKDIFQELYIGERLICQSAMLVSVKEYRSTFKDTEQVQYEPFESKVISAVLEKNHAVKTVVKVTGKYRGRTKEWLPFLLRLTFYRNSPEIRIVHTFFYDGNPNKDIIKGIGLRYCQAMEGELYNRHVRISGDTGFLTESPKMLVTARVRERYETLLREQMEGKHVQFTQDDQTFAEMLEDSAVWNDYRIHQDSASHYQIKKRTKKQCSWVSVKHGRRSNGSVYLGGANGGIFSGIRNFWQKYPAAVDLYHVAEKEAQVTLWFWSPYGESMDLRHYDTDTHMASSYEGFDEMRSTPYGIANTTELALIVCDATPSHSSLKRMEQKLQKPDILVCTPAYYSSARAFGTWQPEDTSTAFGAWFETRANAMQQAFQEQIETHEWYGFWNYGDIMRFYDPVRHCWKFDLGGCAWNNSELIPDMWMWYTFLHSGSSEAFRLAEAYTRHGSEVDQYHFGEYKGLGSRHNVVHWGCGCKEPRISMAGLNRFLYYLTGDERMGEILDEVADADYTTINLDPLRTIVTPDGCPTHARSAPDWSSYCANWMTKWERYQDTRYRDKILAGIDSLLQLPSGLNSGPMFGYDPKTGSLIHLGDNNQSYHMCNCFGAIQVWLELSYMLQNEEFDKLLEEYGAYYILPLEEKKRLNPSVSAELWGMPGMVVPLSAFAAFQTGDKELAKRTWQIAVKELLKPVTAKKVDSLQIPAPVMELEGCDSASGAVYMNLFLAFPYLKQLLTEEELGMEVRENGI
ncbi:MAG: hypothetical protein Q4E24_02175 [bacterium]|nr:hypothetical protein [bacterium]